MRHNRPYHRRNSDGRYADDRHEFDRDSDYDYYMQPDPRNRYRNEDYSERNYWHPHNDGPPTNRYVPEWDYGDDWDPRSGRSDRAYGYGNENSRYMRDYDRMMHGETGWEPDRYPGRWDHSYDRDRDSVIDKQEARGHRGIDNEDTAGRMWRSHRDDNGGFNDYNDFHLFDRPRSRHMRPSIREKRY